MVVGIKSATGIRDNDLLRLLVFFVVAENSSQRLCADQRKLVILGIIFEWFQHRVGWFFHWRKILIGSENLLEFIIADDLEAPIARVACQDAILAATGSFFNRCHFRLITRGQHDLQHLCRDQFELGAFYRISPD